MHAVIITCVYLPEPVVSAQISQDLATRLAGLGWQVTVICPYPTRAIADSAQLVGLFSELKKELNQPRVIRVSSYTAEQSRILSRARESLSFGMSAVSFASDYINDADVIYVNSWPLASQYVIARYCRRQRIPFVLHLQDIYPEALLPKLPWFVRGWVSFSLKRVDRWIAEQATRLVVISENMRKQYASERGIKDVNIETVINWQDERRFVSALDKEKACALCNIDSRLFTFVYLGNIGPVAGLENVIAAFHGAALTRAQLIVAGTGTAKTAAQRFAASLKVRNVKFLSAPDSNSVAEIQAVADVLILPTKGDSSLWSIPSKLPAYLFSGRPILGVLLDGSDTARCIREGECGWVCEPEDVDRLCRKLTDVYHLPPYELHRLGENARIYGLRHFTRERGGARLASIVVKAAGRVSSPVAEQAGDENRLAHGDGDWSGGAVRLVRLEPSHVVKVVKVHLESFPGFFLTFLGEGFLTQFYRAYLADANRIAFAAERGPGEVCGFVVGTLQPRGFFKRLLIRRFWAFGLSSVSALMRKPEIAPRLLRALGYRGNPPRGDGFALLSSIAVCQLSQEGGVGRKLMDRWLAEVQSSGARGAYLTTDADGNDRVNAFYRHGGWRLESTYFTPEKRKMARYIINFAP